MRALFLLLKFSTIALAATGIILAIAWQWFSAPPVARHVPDDGGTLWRPEGIPNSGPIDKNRTAPIAFRTMHVGLNNSDELWIATAPEQQLAWVAEENLYIPEGPTMDDLGQIYFSPLFPEEDLSLVALDGDTGERLWTLPNKGDRRGAGAPLILDTPGEESQQTIYHATYHWAWAVTPSGKILWHKPTGLKYAESNVPHAWGVNYIPHLDAITVITSDGKIAVLERTTGHQLLAQAFELPGLSTSPETKKLPPRWLLNRGDALAEQRFGDMPLRDGLFTDLVRTIYGAGSEVSNFYAVDANTGRMFVAATAPDSIDGKVDGWSTNGSIYALELLPTGENISLGIAARYDFRGGTGSTPTITNDGKRLYVSDENGNVLALDRELNEIWRINLGKQVAASIAVSADNSELYAVTRYDVFKLWDRGSSAEIAWKATLDVYPNHHNVNALTPTITANGLAVSIGASKKVGKFSFLMEAGFGLLDRETGKVRAFVQGVEESISVTSVAADGGFAIAHSPVRRLGGASIFGSKISPISGGIARYKPVNNLRLAREAACAAAAIRARGTEFNEKPEYTVDDAAWDAAKINALMSQATNAITRSELDLPTSSVPGDWCHLLGEKNYQNREPEQGATE